MKIVRDIISLQDLHEMAANFGGQLVKAVVDVERQIIAVDADLHADLEQLLLEDGSAQKNVWGINLYPDQADVAFIEYDSMINVRPIQNNRRRSVEDEEIRGKIVEIVRARVRR